jgi:hypothetical protein
MALSKIKVSSMADNTIHGRRNAIINGGFTCSQRNGSSLTATANNAYCLDRWKIYLNGSCAISTQQLFSSDANVTALNTASGETFNNILSIDCTTASSLGGTDLLGVIQIIEGYTSVPLAGQTCTLSFWVKSNITGQYYVALKLGSGRSYITGYTISSANTWEKKTITFVNDTASNLNTHGSIANSGGLQVYFGLRLGTSSQQTNTLNAWQNGNFYGKSDQVTWGTNTSDTFYMGGIQLEKNSQATPFEHLTYGEELELCQRYYQRTNVGYYAGNATGTTKIGVGIPLSKSMRSSPSSISGVSVHRSGNQTVSATFDGILLSTNNSFMYVRFNGFSSMTDETPQTVYLSSHMLLDSEM